MLSFFWVVKHIFLGFFVEKKEVTLLIEHLQVFF